MQYQQVLFVIHMEIIINICLHIEIFKRLSEFIRSNPIYFIKDRKTYVQAEQSKGKVNARILS